MLYRLCLLLQSCLAELPSFSFSNLWEEMKFKEQQRRQLLLQHRGRHQRRNHAVVSSSARLIHVGVGADGLFLGGGGQEPSRQPLSAGVPRISEERRSSALLLHAGGDWNGGAGSLAMYWQGLNAMAERVDNRSRGGRGVRPGENAFTFQAAVKARMRQIFGEGGEGDPRGEGR